MNKDFDIAIVGAGPAGSSAAIRLARSGARVALIEQKKFPRPKLCGEFVSPECVKYFDELGVTAKLEQLEPRRIEATTFYSRKGRCISVDSHWFGNGHAIGISRAALDDTLLASATEAGVTVLEDTMYKRARSIDDIIELEIAADDTAVVRTNFVIDATGRTRAVARQFDDAKPARADHVAFKAHLTNASIADGACEIYSYKGGYGGCNHVEGGVANLCFIVTAELAREFGSDPMRLVENVVSDNRRAAATLKDVAPVTEWLAVPVGKYGRGTLAPRHNVVSIGDAAAFIDPFTGSGILMALQSGKLAAEAIAAGGDIAGKYEKEYSATFDRRLRVSSMLRYASGNTYIATAIITLLGISSGLRKGVARATRSASSPVVNVDT